MGRYDLRLRPIYGPDEHTGGEALQRGISAAIQQKMAEEQEDNQRRAQGQVMEGEATAGGRLRGIGNRIGSLFGRGGDAAPTPTPFNPGTTAETNAAIVRGVQPMTPNAATGTPGVGTVPPPPGVPRPKVADALATHLETDTHGNSWRIDPNVAIQRGAAVEGAKARADLNVKDEYSEQQIARTVEAAVRGGMPRAEAEVRARTGTFKYDDVYGDPHNSRASGMTPAEFDRRAALRQKNLLELEQMRQSGRVSGQELQRRRMDIAEEERRDRALRGQEASTRADVKTDLGIAGAIDRSIPKDPITRATETEPQKADRERREKERDRRVGAASSAQDRLKNSHATQQSAAARARALQQAGKSRAEIAAIMQAEGYRVSP